MATIDKVGFLGVLLIVAGMGLALARLLQLRRVKMAQKLLADTAAEDARHTWCQLESRRFLLYVKLAVPAFIVGTLSLFLSFFVWKQAILVCGLCGIIILVAEYLSIRIHREAESLRKLHEFPDMARTFLVWPTIVAFWIIFFLSAYAVIWFTGWPEKRIVSVNAAHDDLAHFKNQRNLQTLNLEFTKVTDAGLEHLKGLTKLQELDLRFTEITDAGLVHLKDLTDLQTVCLSKTKVTDAGDAGLRRSLPRLIRTCR